MDLRAAWGMPHAACCVANHATKRHKCSQISASASASTATVWTHTHSHVGPVSSLTTARTRPHLRHRHFWHLWHVQNSFVALFVHTYVHTYVCLMEIKSNQFLGTNSKCRIFPFSECCCWAAPVASSSVKLCAKSQGISVPLPCCLPAPRPWQLFMDIGKMYLENSKLPIALYTA